MTFFTGILIATCGVLLVIYREKVHGFTGDFGFAEKYLGPGGSFTFLLILAVAFFFGGLMWATGTFQDWFINNLGRFFGRA